MQLGKRLLSLLEKNTWHSLITDIHAKPNSDIRSIVSAALNGENVLGQTLHDNAKFISLIVDGPTIRQAGNRAAHETPLNLVKDAV